MTQPYNPFPAGNPPVGYTSPGPSTSSYSGNTGAGPAIPSPTSSNVYGEIEGSADYYEPAIYQLLTSMQSLVTQPDELDGQFIPLTDVQATNPTQTLIMAIGLLPPSSNVTGRLLDRSATIAETMPIMGGVAVNLSSASGRLSSSLGNAVGGAGGRQVAGVPGANQGPPIPLKYSTQQLATAISAAYQAQYGTLPNQTALAIMTAQSIRETGGTWPNNNPGYIGNYAGPGTTGSGHAPIPAGQQTFGFVQGNGSVEYYNSYNTPQAGAAAFVSTLAAKGAIPYANAGDVTGYVTQLHNTGYFTDSVDDYLNGPAGAGPSAPSKSFQNISSISAQIGNPANLSTSTLPGPTLQQLSGGGDGSQPANSWQGSGSKNGNQASQNIANAANTNLNNTNIGQAYLQAQASIINATLAAIQQMQNTPPLKMLVNPQSFKLSAEKIISDGEWGRNGPIVEHWGDNLDKIEASGKVAAFYSMDAGSPTGYGLNSAGGPATLSPGGASGGPGITRIARQYSQAYQNFLSLWLIYKNNGGIWLPPFSTSTVSPSFQSGQTSQVNNLSVLGSVYIFYDNILYLGSFDSFNLTESETAPYTLEYNYSFTVRATFLLDNSTDYSLQLQGLQQAQTNPLQGLPSGLQIATGATALAPNVNPQPAGGVSPPPGLSPAQYAQIGQGPSATTSNSFTNKPGTP